MLKEEVWGPGSTLPETIEKTKRVYYERIKNRNFRWGRIKEEWNKIGIILLKVRFK